MVKKNFNKSKQIGDFSSYLHEDIPSDDESIHSDEIEDDNTNHEDNTANNSNLSFNYPYDDENPISNLNGSNNIDVSGIFSLIDKLGGKNSKIAQVYKNIDENEVEINKPLFDHQQKSYYRQAAYQTIVKDADSWLPQVLSNQFKETLVYGKTPLATVDAQALTSKISPINDFERELAQTESMQWNHEDTADYIEEEPYEPSTKPTSKAMIHRQNMRNKQMNRIKSKSWHKSKRKNKEFLQEKLISRLEVEDPELAKQMKHELEIKAAERRLLRKREAQKKWAKMAMRYGGKEAKSIADKQVQSLSNYEKNIISLAKNIDSESESDSDPDPERSEEEENKTSEEKHSRIYNMKFMKKTKEPDSPTASSPPSSDDETEENPDAPSGNSSPAGITSRTLLSGLKAGSSDKGEGAGYPEERDSPSHESGLPDHSQGRSRRGAGVPPAGNFGSRVEDIVRNERELDKLIEEVPKPNSELAYEIFTGEESLLTDSEDEVEVKEINWGRWITKVDQCIANEPVKKRKVRIKVANDKEKLSKYTVKALPYPYTNSASFNRGIEKPLGPEWNTAKAHKRLIQPKVEIKVGNVIIPIQKKALGNKQETDSILRAFGKASRAQRTMARL